MIESDRVLQPLAEAGAAIDRLQTYESQAQLAEAVRATWQAVDRALRLFLRGDPGAADAVRLAALSPTDLDTNRLIVALRQGERISLELAGMVTELEQAAERGVTGSVRAGDGDLALQVVRRLRSEVAGHGSSPVEPGGTPASRLDPASSPSPGVSSPDLPRRRWWPAAALFIVVVGAGIGVVVWRARPAHTEEGVAAFAAGRYDEAEQDFREAVAADSSDITALLYLARIQRRQERFPEAAATLEAAATRAPADADVRRELGSLFMDLQQPQAAVRQYQRARDLDSANALNWIGLVQALRAAGDSTAEQVLRQAPPAARAALSK